MLTARTCVLALLALASATDEASAQDVFPMGRHRMALQSPGGELHFGLSIEGDGKGDYLVHVINGEERIHIVGARNLEDGTILLPFAHYDSELRLRATSDTLSGEWIKRRGKGKTTRMPVTNVPAERASKAPDWFAGRYDVKFEQSKDPAVGVFQAALGHDTNAAGTFLTTLGDYRFLAGTADKDKLTLSCFDGAHAFLFVAKRQADGSMKGDFWSSDSWHETWTAKQNAKAELPDGWNLTKWRKDTRLDEAKYRDFDGKPRSLDDPAWRGKVRVIEVFGSWCPNCHDHGHYMAELHRRYEARGLQVIGVAFEHDDDFARSVRQVKAFTKRHDATFPILIGGLANKLRATESLGLLDRVRSYPTTIFLDKQGAVRGIYQGFSGPATGEVHQRLRQRFESLIESMLDER